MTLDFFHLVIIPLLIVCARIMDVSLDTFRIILVSKGYRTISAVLGFLESFIWIVVVSQILKGVNNFLYYFAYGIGFALGTYIGVTLEQRVSLGQVIVRIVTRLPGEKLAEYLISKNYIVTRVDGVGTLGKVNILFLVIHRKQLDEVIDIINQYNPNAFYTIEDVRTVSVMHQKKPKRKINDVKFFKFFQR
ncbi:MAG TPA: DUF5698 domain-containing protein [Candidatus Kapabacteria bacterium]|jgi:uncharacterized protein YebE (UPF0316 family)|nr:DUF2179 domain-containing protein [Candidatus Kapabacteria bacterium]HOV92301.1 DUF5698 domain-containing protein [Candidatus Kapabacteria bacterium]